MHMNPATVGVESSDLGLGQDLTDIPAPEFEPDWGRITPSIQFGWSDVRIPKPGEYDAYNAAAFADSGAAGTHAGTRTQATTPDTALAWVEDNWLVIAAALGAVIVVSAMGGGRR